MKTEIHNPNCDGAHCREETGEVRLLPVGGGGNAILCSDCYRAEMAWREETVPAWDELKVYDG